MRQTKINIVSVPPSNTEGRNQREIMFLCVCVCCGIFLEHDENHSNIFMSAKKENEWDYVEENPCS